jgi:hypothetical protein
MKRPLLEATLVILLLVPYQAANCQDQVEPRNKIGLSVRAGVYLLANLGLYEYHYTLTSSLASKQNVWRFWVITRDTGLVQDPTRPVGWFKVIVDANKTKTELTIDWGAPSSLGIRPGDPARALSFASRSLPGLSIYYAEGYAPPPSFEPGMAPDSVPGYTNLTAYGPGVVGKTVGPTLPPSLFDPLAFLDTLLSYTTQSKTLGWMRDQTTADKYLSYFNYVKLSVRDSNFTAARNALKLVLHDVDVDSTSALTSEAYALLRFNTEYLLSQLPLPKELSIEDLIALKHEAQAKGWIADDNFIKELDNGLENAQKHLARGDSVNCAKELQKFQDKVNQVYEKTLEDQQKGKRRDKRFVTLDGYTLLNDSVQSIIDRLPTKKK